MYGYPGRVQLEDVVKEQEKLLKEHIDNVEKFVEERKSKEISKDTNLYKQRLVFTPLDLLIDKYELGKSNPYLEEIDKKYWNMMKAIEDVANELELVRVNKDKYGKITKKTNKRNEKREKKEDARRR